MTGSRAVAILEALDDGRMAEGATPADLEELARAGLACGVEPTPLEWARDFTEIVKRYGAIADAAALAAALARLEAKLKSDFHRLTSFRSTIHREEQDRARIRRLLGVFAEPLDHKAFEAAHEATGSAAPGEAFVACPGTTRLHAITPLGQQAEVALRTRPRFGDRPLVEFLRPFVRSRSGMKELAARARWLEANVPAVPKGREHVVAGLLRSGQPPEKALEAYRSALGGVGHAALDMEKPHLAVASVRAAKGELTPAGATEAAARLQSAYDGLVKRGLPQGPVLRGVAKSLLPYEDAAASADRFRWLYDALCTATASQGDAVLRLAARLMPAKGEPAEVVARCRKVLDKLRALGHAVVAVGPIEVAIAARATDLADAEVLAERFTKIADSLVEAGAFPRSTPPTPTVADLVSVPGAPHEVVQLVHEITEELAPGTPDEGWGSTRAFELACAFARRLAY